MLTSPRTMLLVLAVTCLVHVTETKVVVFLPFPFTSHIRFHTDVARALANKGHEIWVASPTYVLKTDYLDTSGIHVIPYDTIPNLQERTQQQMIQRYFGGKGFDFLGFVRICGNMTDALLKNDSFIRNIKRKLPDLIVIDIVGVFDMMSIIPYRLGAPFAFLGPLFNPQKMRVPFSPVDVPVQILPYSNNMTFWQKVHNVAFYALFPFLDASSPSKAVQKYAPEMVYVSLYDLVSKAELFLIETDHIMDYPKPTLPNVKMIGATTSGPAKALSPKFQSFMDSAKEGVVIVSFGSNFLNPPKRISDKVFEVLLQLPMKSVFRSNLTSPDPTKILISPWIPQNDLLGHPHTKVFVSHCGKGGQYEALYHAVPIVATPFVGDQPYNAERARVKGFAEVLDLNTCTADQMKSTILTVANEPRYRQAVVKRSRLFRELYGVPMETAAYWLDHVMEYGGDYMRSAGQQMPLYQFLLLDVFLLIAFALFIMTVFFFIAIRFVYKCMIKKKSKAD